jgi:putative endonuclease
VDPWFVYIAECSDKSLYVGIARVVKERIAAHNAGRGARYTRGRGPVRAVVTRRCASKGEALRLEARLKRLRRAEKLAMANSRGKLGRFARAVLGSAG